MRRVLLALTVVLILVCAIFTHTSFDNSNSKTIFVSKTYDQLDKDEKSEIDCLALNIYREAGIEKDAGKFAVALVTMNRVKARGFPTTVCKVVSHKTNGTCQFSWKCMHSLPKIDWDIYTYSRNIAIQVFLNHDIIDDITGGALFYHADYVRPRWSKLEVTTKIGRHIFYKPTGVV